MAGNFPPRGMNGRRQKGAERMWFFLRQVLLIHGGLAVRNDSLTLSNILADIVLSTQFFLTASLKFSVETFPRILLLILVDHDS